MRCGFLPLPVNFHLSFPAATGDGLPTVPLTVRTGLPASGSGFIVVMRRTGHQGTRFIFAGGWCRGVSSLGTGSTPGGKLRERPVPASPPNWLPDGSSKVKGFLESVHGTPKEDTGFGQSRLLAANGGNAVQSTEGFEALLSKLCDEGELDEAFQTLEYIAAKGVFVSPHMLYLLLRGCIAQKNLAIGRRVHALTVLSGLEQSTFLGNQVIRMYASHGCLVEANQVFSKLPAPDTFAWASIISANGEHGQADQSLKIYQRMHEVGIKPNDYIFVAVLKACGGAGDLTSGKLVHADVLASGFESNVFVGNTLVDMYARCGSLVDARRVFDTLSTRNLVTWNAMIAGYAQRGLGEEALELFDKMQQSGIVPNNVTFVSILTGCGSIGRVEEGREIHDQIRERGLEADVFVGTALMNMYVKCKCLEEARGVFDSLPSKNVVTWTAMITGYAQQGFGQEALELYDRMQKDGKLPDNVTFVSALQACGTKGALQAGKQIHAQVLKRGLLTDVIVGNSLVDMYVKCGRLEEAQTAFDSLQTRDTATWNTLVNGYGQHSQGQLALQCFDKMLEQGFEPNASTFTCLLVACSHVGLVSEGQQYFKLMQEAYGIRPSVEHYNCMVDLLGRSGCLQDAESLLQSMPFKADSVGWTSLLNACKSHGNVELGRQCFDRLVRMNPQEASAYVLMTNMYVEASRWEEVEEIENLRKDAGAQKKPARASIEVNNKVHEFVVGDTGFEMSDSAYTKLRSLGLQMKEEGFVPRVDSLLKPDQRREDALCGHAEKLALSFGILNTPEGTGLLITKDLRMCNNCHGGTKFISRIERREITIRDSHRVHRFKDGACSCGDHY